MSAHTHSSALHDVEHDLAIADQDIREGQFQRSLAFIAGGASVTTALEVAYEHYRGSYSNRVMYTPVVLSVGLGGASLWAVFSKRAASGAMRWTAALTLLDAVVGFGFHIRGVHRKPGGWRLPVTNIVTGPPLFAPLLFGTAAYLALIASYLRREGAKKNGTEGGAQAGIIPHGAHPRGWSRKLRGKHAQISWEQDIREGRFQKHLAFVTGLSSLFSGAEALYSHYKVNFWHWSQWTPIVVSPLLAAASFGAMGSKTLAQTALPATSALACLDASVGFFYHARGVLRRPGGRKHLLYNIMYGPPIFAPLLFGAAGMLGLLASLMRREKK